MLQLTQVSKRYADSEVLAPTDLQVPHAETRALIGAGGYGQPILTGIRLDDTSLILQGAVPAAVLALLVQGLFELLERRLLPRSLRAQAYQKGSAA
jgi:osmoprotectant transport system permease protein